MRGVSGCGTYSMAQGKKLTGLPASGLTGKKLTGLPASGLTGKKLTGFPASGLTEVSQHPRIWWANESHRYFTHSLRKRSSLMLTIMDLG